MERTGARAGSSQPPRKDGALSAPRASLAFRLQSHRAAHRLTVPHAVARGPLPCFSPGPTVALMHMAPVLPTLKLLGQPWGPGVYAPGGLGHVTDPPCPLHKRGPDAITSALCRHCHRLYFLTPRPWWPALGSGHEYGLAFTSGGPSPAGVKSCFLCRPMAPYFWRSFLLCKWLFIHLCLLPR